MGLNAGVVAEREQEIGRGFGEAGDRADFDAVLADLRVRNILAAAVWGDELDRWALGRCLAEIVCGEEG